MTRCLSINKENIRFAVTLLNSGKLIAFPTETVYGLGADGTNDQAIALIYTTKGRPRFNPLISHVSSLDDVFNLGIETPTAIALAREFWPGPMTLILQRKEECPVSFLATAGLDKIALRIPSHVEALDLLKSFGKPIVAPSANLSGQISPSRAEHVLAQLDKKIDLVLDGGPCLTGIESTVIDCSEDKAVIFRPGGITTKKIMSTLIKAGLPPPENPTKILSAGQQHISPGQLASHYAPRASLRIMAKTAKPNEELIGFGKTLGSGRLSLNLSANGDLSEAAANLFNMLHIADNSGTSLIAVAPVPDKGLGEAINDRLKRAAGVRNK